jgi:large subunit ribosomal protein L24
MAARIRKGDRVVVTAGKSKGVEGEVLKVLPDADRVVVQGAQMIKRHNKPSARGAGGIDNREAPLHVSNIAHLDPHDGKPTRIGFKFLEDGRKVRYAKRSGEIIDR